MKEFSTLKGVAAALVAALMVLSLGTATVSAESGSDLPRRFDVDFEIAQMWQQAQGGGSVPNIPRTRPLSLVGQLGPADEPLMGFPNSDVWVHKKFAYVGTWGFFGFCPATGVKVIDISDPSNPELVTTISSHPDTRANDVKVDKINTRFFKGDLLVHSDEPCGPAGIGGFHLIDVTDPANPVHLSKFATGPVHNLYLYERGHRAFVLLSIPFSEVFGPGFPFPGETSTDFAIVEVTDPTDPVLVGTWTIGRDAGLAFGSPIFAEIFPLEVQALLAPGFDCTPPPGTPELCRGADFPGVFNHDVWANKQGTVAYVSYWDAGLILLDISDPTSPTLIGRGVELATFGGDEGNAHNAVPARGGKLVLVGDEDFTEGPWGFLRIFDTSDPSNPVEIGAFATDRALTASGCCFSIHNVVVKGNMAFISWYTEGIRVIDFSKPDAPREIASFSVPFEEGFTLFWGVDVERNLIFGSDIFTGLYILKR